MDIRQKDWASHFWGTWIGKLVGWKRCYYGLVKRPVYWYLETPSLS